MKRDAVVIGFATTVIIALLVCGCSGSSSSSSPRDCADAGAINGSCESIANEIRLNGGATGTCTNPSAKFAKACAALQSCSQCLGIDGGP